MDQLKGVDDALAAGIAPRVYQGKDAQRYVAQTYERATWGEIRELPNESPVAPSIDGELAAQMIPAPLVRWLVDIADRLSVSVESAAVIAFSVIGSVIGRKVGLRPKRLDDWVVTPTFWALLVAHVGTKKTPLLTACMRPLQRLEAKERKKWLEGEPARKAAAARAKLQLQELNDRLKAAVSSGNQKTCVEIERQIAELERTTPKESQRRYIVNDPTTEKLGELLRDNPNGLLLFRDEVCALIASFDRQGREGDRQFYLESWGGNGSISVDRIGRGHIHVPHLCMSIIGGIQPSKPSHLVRELSNPKSGDDGFIARFSLMVYPERRPPNRHDIAPDIEAADVIERMFDRLDSLTSDALQLPSDADLPYLRFAPDAQDVYDEWSEELEYRLHSDDLEPAIAGHLAKYRRLMPGLALLFELVCWAAGQSEGKAVSRKSAVQAAEWCGFLEAHANKVYDPITNQGIASARALARRIRRGEVSDGMTVRELQRRAWSGLTDRGAIEEAITCLASHNWIKVEQCPAQGNRGGASSAVLRLHPDLKKGDSGALSAQMA